MGDSEQTLKTQDSGLLLLNEERSEAQSQSWMLYVTMFFFCFLVFFFFFVLFLVLVFRDRVSLYSPGCPGTHFVDQAGLELRDPPASASRVLGLKACATTPPLKIYLLPWGLGDKY
jgi:hypothetical protein